MKITITKREYQRFYIYNYYYGRNSIVNSLRQLMGPILTAIGLYLYLFSTVKDDSTIGFWAVVFCLAYGFFYTLKPLLILLTLNPVDETFEYSIKNNFLYIKDRLKEGSIDLTESKLQENKNYFFVKIENNQVIFFPKNLMDKKAISIFQDQINNFNIYN